MLIRCLVVLGRRAEAERSFRQMQATFKREYFFPEVMGDAALALGYRDQALDWYELGVELHSAGAPVTWLFPEGRELMTDPRFRRTLERMHLDDVAK